MQGPLERHPTILAMAPPTAAPHADWTLPAGFNIELYFPRVFVARSLAVSGNSQANGPVIAYVGSNGGILNVRPTKGRCFWCARTAQLLLCQRGFAC